MQKMTVQQLTDTIQAVKQAVDASDFGPVYDIQMRNDQMTKVVSPLGAQIFATTLQQILAKMDTVSLAPNPPESPLAD